MFQFTPVVRRATKIFLWRELSNAFQFTPVVRRATITVVCLRFRGKFQFTPVVRRATRAGRRGRRGSPSFNSRPSCDGRLHDVSLSFYSRMFQFTPVVRRATPSLRRREGVGGFNSRPSCDGRHSDTLPNALDNRFNSRPSCDGRQSCAYVARYVIKFQFTPVVRRATSPVFHACGAIYVSIHARRATGDLHPRHRPPIRAGFNSRPSCDGRPSLQFSGSAPPSFQFTPVVRRATKNRPNSVKFRLFQFTPVVRRATARLACGVVESVVSIHARRATGDIFPTKNGKLCNVFQFTPVVRRATSV